MAVELQIQLCRGEQCIALARGRVAPDGTFAAPVPLPWTFTTGAGAVVTCDADCELRVGYLALPDTTEAPAPAALPVTFVPVDPPPVPVAPPTSTPAAPRSTVRADDAPRGAAADAPSRQCVDARHRLHLTPTTLARVGSWGPTLRHRGVRQPSGVPGSSAVGVPVLHGA